MTTSDEAWLAAAVDELYDIVVALDESFTVVYANRYAHEFVGVPEGGLIGTSITELLHPDDVERAAGVAINIANDSMGDTITPALYRIRHRSGGWLTVEINATPTVAHPDGDRFMVLGRYSGDRNLQEQIAQLLIRGAPMLEVIELLPTFGTWRHPDDHYSVVYTDSDGSARVIGSPLLTELIALDAVETPWGDALAKMADVIVDDPAKLAEPLRSAAIDAGLGSVWARPVAGPPGEAPAVIVAWFPEGRPVASLHRYALDKMSQALTLLLQWNQQLTGLQRAATQDGLTGLANRASFFELLSSVCAQIATDGCSDATAPIAGVLYVDLDGFKAINDNHGHRAGDELLALVASRFRNAVRKGDLVGRLGGDEFGVLCPAVSEPSELEHLAARLVGLFDEPLALSGTTIGAGASIGIASTDTTGPDPDRLVDAADQALYEAKRAGRGRWAVADAPLPPTASD